LGYRRLFDNNHIIHMCVCGCQVSQWYDLVVFTASMEIYGAAVAEKLDRNRGILKRRYYRQVVRRILFWHFLTEWNFHSWRLVVGPLFIDKWLRLLKCSLYICRPMRSQLLLVIAASLLRCQSRSQWSTSNQLFLYSNVDNRLKSSLSIWNKTFPFLVQLHKGLGSFSIDLICFLACWLGYQPPQRDSTITVLLLG